MSRRGKRSRRGRSKEGGSRGGIDRRGKGGGAAIGFGGDRDLGKEGVGV